MNALPLIIFLIFVAPGIIFLFFVLKLFLKGKRDSWEGVVVDKGHVVKEKEDEDSWGVVWRKGPEKKEHFYHIKVKIEEGKNKGEVHAIAVPPEMYEEIKVGDRLRKEKGALWPKKIG